MLDSLLSDNLSGVHFILRWLHVYFGILWIGLLYYFNFVQGSFMAEADPVAKAQVIQKLLPRAMWWFRYAALWTFILGFLMLMIRSHQDMSAAGAEVFQNSYWTNILTGALLGTLMFLNVWGIIWRGQKIVIENAKTVASGGAANPAAGPAAARALLASRTNTLFSVPMLFFMLAAPHLGYNVGENSNVMLYWILALVIIGGIEINAIKGKLGPMTTIKGVITGGFVLTAVFAVLIIALI